MLKKEKVKKGRIFSGIAGFQKKAQTPLHYDKERQRPTLRCSICTGEQVAGFKDLETGKFEEVMLIRGEKDLAAFQEMYGIGEVVKEY